MKKSVRRELTQALQTKLRWNEKISTTKKYYNIHMMGVGG